MSFLENQLGCLLSSSAKFSIQVALCPACGSRPKVGVATARKFSAVRCFGGFYVAPASVFRLEAGGCVSQLVSVFSMGFSFLYFKK